VWFVYFLQLRNRDIYVGFTRNVAERVIYHDNGHVPSTRPHRPVRLRAYVAVETGERALALERYFKSGSGKAVAMKRFL
jgi:predicted GIY-YIG superfamily endonuclease